MHLRQRSAGGCVSVFMRFINVWCMAPDGKACKNPPQSRTAKTRRDPAQILDFYRKICYNFSGTVLHTRRADVQKLLASLIGKGNGN